MDYGEKKKIVLQAREKFLKETSSDSKRSSTQQFDERIERYRYLSSMEHDVQPNEEGQFRPRSSSYGQAVSPNLSARIKGIKDYIKKKTKLTGSSESISGKSPPSQHYLTPLRIPSNSEKYKSDSPSPSKWTKPTGSRQNSQNDSPATIPSIESDYYNMNNKSRGKVLIFNHVSFQDEELPEREGAEEDVKNLQSALLKLKFVKDKIEVLKDYSFSDITKKLDSVGQEDHTDNDLLMVFVLTHGEKDDRIHAFDHEYQVSKLWRPFTAEKCKSLAGKPKIFFIVACRGDSQDGGAQITMAQNRRKASINTETDAALMGPVVSYTIPVWADFLTIYSTVQGYFSYRDADAGTWYIKALCDQIRQITEKNEAFSFTDLLVKVNRKVAITYETYHENPAYSKKKQCPFISSTLTRLIKFEPTKSTSTLFIY